MVFKPGQSGNPGGRPKQDNKVRELAQAHTEAAISGLAAVLKDKKAPAASRVSAAVALLDRGWGKPAQPIDGDGDGGAMQIIHEIRRTIVDPRPTDG